MASSFATDRNLKRPGEVHVIVGPMFAGKTTALLRRVKSELNLDSLPGVTFLEYGNIQAATEMIQIEKIAAVFVEPIQGEGGIYSATKEFLQSLRTACDGTGPHLNGGK